MPRWQRRAIVAALAVVVLPRALLGLAGDDPTRPPAGVDVLVSRPFPAPPAPTRTEGFEFTGVQPDGEPVAYDPCRLLRIVVNERTAPAGSGDLLQLAIDRVTEATGLRLLVVGTTDEGPDPERAPYQPDRYGERWAPILVAWSDQYADPSLGVDAVARAGSTSASVPGTGERAYVTGLITLDGPTLARHDRGTIFAVLLHELGHLVGLDHVDDAAQLMYDRPVPAITSFEAGDLAGLAHLGRGPCRPEL